MNIECIFGLTLFLTKNITLQKKLLEIERCKDIAMKIETKLEPDQGRTYCHYSNREIVGKAECLLWLCWDT